MNVSSWKVRVGHGLAVAGMIAALTASAWGQYGGGTTASTASAVSSYNFSNNFHIGFERPESWALKYFTSSTLLSGLLPPDPPEGRHFGSINVGLELDWMPQLDAGQQLVGFNGTSPEALNKAPIMARPVVRVGLPDKFAFVITAPPPFHMFGVTAHLLALGVERPLIERDRWTLSWRGSGQFGHVKGAFTCPRSVLGFEPGSPQNPTECVAESADEASLRYIGSEFEFAYKIPNAKWSPHAAVGGNFVDGVFQTHALIEDGLDQTRMWTRGGTVSTSGGITYMVTKRAAFTVDMFYTPLWVKRNIDAPRTNDGLFNVRALLSYSFGSK